jgi:hypothetical protein
MIHEEYKAKIKAIRTQLRQLCSQASELEAEFSRSLGGVHVNDQEPTTKMFHIQLQSSLDPQAIAAYCLLAVDPNPTRMTECKQIGFLRLIESLKSTVRALCESRTNSEIEARFIAGSGSRLMTGRVTHRASLSQ